ncbi:hypothetical protein P3T76_001179 [Phytophthora citrophthora]|uniref:Uncharacterized protein n=1 Tax=Phytophthora citrophthora TaxID=4793 RepID=A0AAD9LUH3_9STRA|nr:hypothetical protein P3T76_001179 [Phytophthora citrophthora]
MRCWAILLSFLAVGCPGVDAASHSTFALWPQQTDATLALSAGTGIPHALLYPEKIDLNSADMFV